MEITGNVYSLGTHFGYVWNIVWSIVIGAGGIVAGIFLQGRKQKMKIRSVKRRNAFDLSHYRPVS